MSKWTQLNWPDRFGGSIRDLAERANLIARRNGDHWRITTGDQYAKQPAPEFFSYHGRVAADPGSRDRAQRILEEWDFPHVSDEASDERATREIRRLLHLDDDDDPTIGEFTEATRLQFLLMPNDEFVPWILDGVSQGMGPQLPDAGVALISISQVVHQRMAFVRALFTILHAPEWLDNVEFQGFGAMRGLSGGVLDGNTQFLHPVLLAHSPWVFGFPAARLPHGIGVFMFGNVLAGRDTLSHSNLLQQFSAGYLIDRQGVRAPSRPTLTTADADAAIEWWVRQVNGLLAVSLDPTLFVDADGWYLPERHLAHLVSIDRLFASVTSSLVQWGDDEYARSSLLFESLDLIEGLGLGDYDRLLSPRSTASALKRIEFNVPSGADKVILPRCESATAALEEVMAHFHPSRVRDNQLLTTAKSGASSSISLNTATARFLRTVRNAKHTLDESTAKPHTMSILSAHDGHIPGDLGDLAFLHLVHMVTQPGEMKRRIQATRH